MSENYRIENPKDEFRKILHTKLGKESHEYFGFHGEFRGPEPCKKPETDRELPPTYLNYYIHSEEYGNLMNSIFYEDVKIDEEYLEKIYFLCINFSCPFKRLPTLNIITKLPLEECTKKVELGSLIVYPIMFSFADYDSKKHFKKINEKINANDEFSNVEALDILFIVSNCKNNQISALEKVCETVSQMKIRDNTFKANLKEAMRCIIHEFAESIDDIKKLEKVIDGNSH